MPGRLPGSRQALAAVLGRARSGGLRRAVSRRPRPGAWPARTMPPVVEVPPGVDLERFRPLSTAERAKARAALGLPADGPAGRERQPAGAAQGHGRPIAAAAALAPSFPELTVRHRRRRARPGPARRRWSAPRGAGAAARAGSTDDELPGSTARPTSSPWPAATAGSGLEQEGFGIVFLEAAAAGVAQVAGRSGGADEAVVDGETGLVVADPGDPGAVAGGAAAPARRRRAAAADGAGRPAPGSEQSFGYGTSSHIGWPTPCRTWKAERRPPARVRERRRGAAPEVRRELKETTVAELATERMVVAAHAGAVLRRGERHRALPGVGGRHQGGRGPAARRRRAGPPRSTFRAGAFGRSTSYTLSYDYSGAPRALAWKQTAGDLTSKLDGQLQLRAGRRRLHRGDLHPRGRAPGARCRASSSGGPRAGSCTPPSRSSRHGSNPR